jgi:nitrite reductase (NO-forming)
MRRLSRTFTGLLSEIIDDPLDRRSFLQRATIAGAALTAASCQRSEPEGGTAVPTDQGGRPLNSNSRNDSTLGLEPVASSAGAGSIDPSAIPYRSYDPALSPLSDERTLRLNWRAEEVGVRINDNTVVAAWTFEGDVPGPVVHVRQGDTVEFTLTNAGAVPHSMDFHAAQVDPKAAFRSVPQGESVTFTFRPRYAGAYMYHCGTGPVLMHIGAGMYGAIIVDPPDPLPPAREFVLVQSEYYVSPAVNGVMAYDYAKMAGTFPDYVVFNGRPDQYVREPIHVRVGERVRFHVVAAGPTHPCNFHIVGEQFDTVYMGAPPSGEVRGTQTVSVAPGGGMTFDFLADVPGEFPFVNHGFGHGQKGAIGFLVVEE